MRKLLLCAGPTRPVGFVRLDQNPEHKPDILATVPPLPAAVHAEPWDLIELIHGIEHFWLWDAGPLLAEVYSVLRPGGVLVLEQPNLAHAVKAMAALAPRQMETFASLQPAAVDDPMRLTMWPIYGDPAHRDPGYMHRWGYTPDTLCALLHHVAPWARVQALPQQYHTYAMGRDFRVEATK